MRLKNERPTSLSEWLLPLSVGAALIWGVNLGLFLNTTGLVDVELRPNVFWVGVPGQPPAGSRVSLGVYWPRPELGRQDSGTYFDLWLSCSNDAHKDYRMHPIWSIGVNSDRGFSMSKIGSDPGNLAQDVSGCEN